MSQGQDVVEPTKVIGDPFAEAWIEDDQKPAGDVKQDGDEPSGQAPEAPAPDAQPVVKDGGNPPAAQQDAVQAQEQQGGQPASQEPQGSAGDEEARRKEANEKSMQGRLDAERRKNEELANRLRALEAQVAARQQPQSTVQRTPQQATSQRAPDSLFGSPVSVDRVDEETRELVEAFAKANPDLAPLIVEDSKEGERLRRILNEFGSDYTATAAEMTVKTRQLEMAEAARAKASEESVVLGHLRTLAHEHPEFAEALTGSTSEALRLREEMNQQLSAWIDTLPYKQGVYAQNVLSGGTTEQVSFILGKFKEAKAAAAAPQQGGSVAQPPAQAAPNLATQRAAEAGFAVQVRSGSALPRQEIPKDDWDAVWDLP